MKNKDFTPWTLGTSTAPIEWSVETKSELTCPNCLRSMPSKKHLTKTSNYRKCLWCDSLYHKVK